jgi:hypothetical protein
VIEGPGFSNQQPPGCPRGTIEAPRGDERGERNESIGIGKENLPQLQDHPPQRRGPGHLHRTASQAAPGLIAQSIGTAHLDQDR